MPEMDLSRKASQKRHRPTVDLVIFACLNIRELQIL